MGARWVLYGWERGVCCRWGGGLPGNSGLGGAVGGARGLLGCWREATVALRAVTYAERAVSSPSRQETCTCSATVSRLPGDGVAIELGHL